MIAETIWITEKITARHQLYDHSISSKEIKWLAKNGQTIRVLDQ
jgi:hypothetical protein